MFHSAPLTAAIAFAACLFGTACGGNDTPAASHSTGTTSGTPTPSNKGVTNITVAGGSGGPSGALTGASAACVDEGQAGFQIAMQGSISGSTYVLKFNAPSGQTDLSTPTTQDIVVLFAQLPAGSNWGGDPRAHKGSGTLTVNGSQGGRLALHLIAGPGSAVTTPVDLSGTWVCSSSTTG
jgi:hypothetical protein